MATLAVEGSAQPRSAPESTLSDAVAEALQGPFHGDDAPPGLNGNGLFLPAATPLVASSRDVGLAVSLALRSPSQEVPVTDNAPSRGKVLLWTTLAAAVGYVGAVQWEEWCTPSRDVGRYDDRRYDPRANLFGSERHQGLQDFLCPDNSDNAILIGFLATIPMTGGAATLAGSGFGRSLVGSALGFGGGVAALVGIQLIGDRMQPKDFYVSDAVVVGVLSLTHAAIATLIAS